MSFRRTFISLALILLLAVCSSGAFVYARQTQEQPRHVVVGEQTYVVATQDLNASSWVEKLTITGTVLADREVNLRPLVPGKVMWVHPGLRDGGAVSESEPLLQIDTTSYAVTKQQADLRLSTARDAKERRDRQLERQQNLLTLQLDQLSLSEADLARQKDLLDQGLIAPAGFEQAKSQTLSQRQSVSNTENSIEQLRDEVVSLENNLKDAELAAQLADQSLQDTMLTAPFDGLVMQSNVQEGQLVSSGDLAVRLYDDSKLSLAFHLPQATFTRLYSTGRLMGQQLRLQWPEFNGALDATITGQGASLDASESGVPLFARLSEDASAAGIRPGTVLSADLSGERLEDVFSIPRRAYFGDIRFDDQPDGGIYLVTETRVRQGAEWQGPTDRTTIRAVNNWLDAYEGEPADLGAALLPAGLGGKDEDTPLSEIYVCKPAASRNPGNRGGRRARGQFGGPGNPGRNRARRNQQTRAQDTNNDGSQRDDDAGRKVLNRPDLRPPEIRVLCPPVSMKVASAVPAELIKFSGDQALVRARPGHELEGKTLVATRFDRLSSGVWLSIAGENEI